MSRRLLQGLMLAASLCAAGICEPARAITVTPILNDTTHLPTTSNGFSYPTLTLAGTTIDWVNTSVTNQYRSPWEGTEYADLPYTSIRSGTAIFNLTGTSLAFLWGSPDAYNTLTFYTGPNGTGDYATVIGSSLGYPQALSFHLVQFATDQVFHSVSFSSTQPAFEIANLTATPLPAAFVLFASGLGMFGLTRLRRGLAALRGWILGRRLHT